MSLYSKTWSVPDNAITMEIAEYSYINKDISNPDNLHHNVSCCVSIGVKGVTSIPTVNWHNARGEMISNGGSFQLQQAVVASSYCTLIQFSSKSCGDKLLCRATLLYSTDSKPLVKTMEYSIAQPTKSKSPSFNSYFNSSQLANPYKIFLIQPRKKDEKYPPLS